MASGYTLKMNSEKAGSNAFVTKEIFTKSIYTYMFYLQNLDQQNIIYSNQCTVFKGTVSQYF